MGLKLYSLQVPLPAVAGPDDEVFHFEHQAFCLWLRDREAVDPAACPQLWHSLTGTISIMDQAWINGNLPTFQRAIQEAMRLYIKIEQRGGKE